MEVEIKVPDLGEGASEATFTAWLKNVGDTVQAGEGVAEIMTEKVNLEVESPVSGVLHWQVVQLDEMVVSGAVLGIVRTE